MADLTRRRLTTAAGWRTGPYGPNGAVTISGADSADFEFTSGAFTIGVVATLDALPTGGQYPTFYTRHTYASESSNSGVSMFIHGDLNRVLFNCYGNNSQFYYAVECIPPAIPADGLYHLTGTSDGSTTRRLYVNAVQQATSGWNINPNAYTGQANIGTVGGTPERRAFVAYQYARELSAAEVISLHNDWYQFVVPRRRVVFVGGVFGGATTIDLTAASFSFTRPSPQLRLAASLTAASHRLVANSITNRLLASLSAAQLSFSPKPVQPSLLARMGAAVLTFTANAITTVQDTVIQLTSAVLNFSAKAITTTVTAVSRGIGIILRRRRR